MPAAFESSAPTPPAALALVWIDSREASIVRDDGTGPTVERLMSDVPPHRRARGNQQHSVPAGGGDAEPRRMEHLAHFIREVVRRVPAETDVLIVGPGTVRWRLAKEIRAQDVHHGLHRAVHCMPGRRQTRRQLIATYRRATDEPVRRRTVGAYRWSRPLATRGHAVLPVRVSDRPVPTSGEVRDGT